MQSVGHSDRSCNGRRGWSLRVRASSDGTPKAARLTIDGVTHTTRPATCSQEHSYRTIDIRNHDSTVQAVVLLSGDRVIPQWVKIRNVDRFNGSFWHGGVGNARADRARNTYTVAGSAYGISSKKPNTVVSTDFNILAEC